MKPVNLALGTLFTLTLLAAFPRESLAQDRQGVWFGLGAGYGSADVSCGSCEDSEREHSGSAYLRGGYTLTPRVLLGGEFSLWNKTFEEFTANIYSASATVTFYPALTSGFFVKGGVGASLLDMDIKAGPSTISVDLGRGLGLTGGAGYDFRVGRNISITPGVNVSYGRLGNLVVGAETIAKDWRQNVLDFTIGITFH